VDRWELSHGIVGANAPSWLTFEVHRPYLDGSASPLTVIQARAAVLAARRFDQRAPGRLRFGMTMPSSYRRLLIDESGLRRYDVADPAGLPESLASPAWRRLADAYRERAALDPVDRAGLAQWLVAVCLLPAVLEVVPDDLSPDTCADPAQAALQSARAIALFGSEGFSQRTNAAYRSLVDTPHPTITHVQSLAGWGYLLARHAGDGSAAPKFLAQARRLLADAAQDELTDFERGLLSVRLAVRQVMLSERDQDFDGATEGLSAAHEQLAALKPLDEDDELLLLESRRRLLDRRLEIAVRRRDADAERTAIDEGILLDPTCIKIRMQKAQADERAGEDEQALAGYLHAARLGPLGTAFALLRAAECAGRLGQGEFARVLRERAFRTAPRAQATREALIADCTAAGDDALADVVRRASARDPKRPYLNNWHYQMYGAYFNLGESHSPGLYARLPTLAFEAAQRGERPEVNWQRLLPPAFRRNLVRESGLTGFDVSHPADLPAALRTAAWDELCGWIEQFDQFDPQRQHQIALVLFKLGFVQLVLDLVPAVPAAELQTPQEMRLQHWRDVVGWVASVGRKPAVPENSFAIARLEHCPTELRYVIAVFAVIYHARETRSVEEAVAWREIAASCLGEQLARADSTPFERTMLESRFYRSVSYVPFLQKEHVRVVEEMTRCEELARAVPAATPYEEFLKRENLRACLETFSKVRYQFGRRDEGDELVEQVLALDPYEPKSHVETAQALTAHGRAAEAANSYLRTARLGPVSTAMGYAMAGNCFRDAGSPILAEDCYFQTLRLDPYAISAARGWAAVGGVVGMGTLAEDYLSTLEAWGAARRAARAA
jgi:hypothetical protein